MRFGQGRIDACRSGRCANGAATSQAASVEPRLTAHSGLDAAAEPVGQLEQPTAAILGVAPLGKRVGYQPAPPVPKAVSEGRSAWCGRWVAAR